MKHFFYTLAFVFLLFSCEKSTQESPKNKDVNYETVDTSRLTNYNYISDNTTEQKSISVYAAAPTIPSGAKELNPNYQSYKVSKNDNYHLPAGNSLITDLKFDKNVNYYVSGTLTVSSAYGSNGNIYVLEGGVLNYNTGNITQGTTINNYGEMNLGNPFSISDKGSIYNYNSLYATGTTTLDGGLLSSEGYANFDKVYFNKKAFNQTLNFQSCVSANYVEFNNKNTMVKFFSSLIVDGDIILNGGMMYLGKEVIVDCEDFSVETDDVRVIGQKNNSAVIDAQKFVIKNKNTNKIFTGSLDLHADVSNLSGSSLKWQSSILFRADTYIAGDGCKPSFGTDPDAAPSHTLVHISDLSPAEIDLSATALSFDDDLTYISWHKKGNEYKGWIDVVGKHTVGSSEYFEIKASYSTPNIDFNSLYNSPNYGITVSGGNAAGALVGFINYSPSSEGEDLAIDIVKIPGSSGNYLLEKDDELMAVSGGKYAAVSTIDYVKQEAINSIAMPYLKCIFDWNEDIFVLYDVKSGDAKIKNIVSNEEFSVGNIDPVDGKNACTIDLDGNIYVPMGRNGMKVFKDGIEVNSFTHPEQKLNGDMANAVSVDEEFVYIAYGTLGLVVLKKSDYSIVAEYNCYSDASCNFVLKRDNGLLYVAYGTSGLHVLRLEELE